MKAAAFAAVLSVSGCDAVMGAIGSGAADGADTTAPASEPAAAAAPAAAAERYAFPFTPVGPEAEALGPMKMVLPPGNQGPGRTFDFANGTVVEATLLGPVDITLPIGELPLNEVLGVTQPALENDGNPKVYVMSVQSEVPGAEDTPSCGDAGSPQYILVRQPETEADKSVTLAFLSANPTDPLVQLCRRVVYLPG